jgi:pimeloyl-ACP methyl ester carboxylesterase
MVESALKLHAEVEGSGAPLVMLGGGTFGATALAPHAQILASEFRVIRLQTLNVDLAEARQPLPIDYSVGLESRAMANALDALQVRTPVDIFGWSYGGLIALDFALTHPDRVRALALFEPPAFWAVPSEELATSPDMRPVFELGKEFEASTDPTDEQAVRFYEALGSVGAQPPAAESPEWQDWTIRRAALKCLPAISRHTDRPERLAVFPRRVLVMHGSNTVPFHRRISEVLASILPLAESVELEGTHVAPLTSRDAFLDALCGFFESAGVGLCLRCRHVERVISAHRVTYYKCRLSALDPRFPKYPPLPIVSCAGYEPQER